MENFKVLKNKKTKQSILMVIKKDEDKWLETMFLHDIISDSTEKQQEW